jgi:hypothetical protein
LYSSPDIRAIKARRMRWAGHAERKGRTMNFYIILVGTYERKRILARSRRRWEDRWILVGLVQDRVQWETLVNALINPQVPLKGREFLHQLSDYIFHKMDFASWNLLCNYR